MTTNGSSSGYWFPRRLLHAGHPPVWCWLFPPFWLVLVPAYAVWLVAVAIWLVIAIPVNLIRIATGQAKAPPAAKYDVYTGEPLAKYDVYTGKPL